jgi:hypothetical protein
MACLSTADGIGAISEPIPLGTPVLPELGALSWEAAPAAPIGTSRQVGSLSLIVSNVIRPANHVADEAMFYSDPARGMEYVAVEVSVTCNLPAEQSCQVSTSDFAASGAQGTTYLADFILSGVRHALEAGELKGGKSRSGYVLFVVDRGDRDLVLRYPHRMGLPGPSATFVIEE